MSDIERLLRPRSANVQQDASFLRRAGAFIFDILLLDLIITVPLAPVFKGLVARAQTGGWWSLTYTNKEMGALLLLLLIAYTYFVVLEYLLGQTVGMMLLDIRVDPAPRLRAAALRNCFLLPIGPLIVLWVLEPLAILLYKRSLLEYLSGTRTVRQRQVLI
jgi:hypothetical protein